MSFEVIAFHRFLSQVVGVEVGGDDDVFGGGGGIEDGFEVAGEDSSVGAAQEELEAELGVRSGEGRGDGVPEDDVLPGGFRLELAVEGFEGELGASFVAGSREEEGQVGDTGG